MKLHRAVRVLALAITAVSVVAACGASPTAPPPTDSTPQTSTSTAADSTPVTSDTPVASTDAGATVVDPAPEPPRPVPTPPGLNLVGVVEALGGRLDEAAPPVYPPAFVESCWDGLVQVYYLYVVDPEAVDLAAVEPHLGGAPLELVTVKHSRDQLHDWEEQSQAALRDESIPASVNLSVVAPAWPSGDRFCSPTGPYLEVEIHDGTPAEELVAVLPAVPPELVLVVHGEQSVFLSSG